jgi:SAM-dependent methyltransferase
MSAINDPKAVRRQYATDERVRIRQEIHDKYTVPRVNFPEWVISNFRWNGDERVLDVGSGAGLYYPILKRRWANLEYHGMDISAGMLAKHPARKSHEDTLSLADAQQLPYPDSTFDMIMANHMLYHVPGVDQAIQEFRRVLKPEGVLMVATNSQQSMPELQVLMRRAIILLTRSGAAQIQPPLPASDLFALENGSRHLARYFYAVVRYDLPGSLVFTEIDPLMAYLESTRDLREPQLPKDVAWEDVMVIMRQQVTHLINHLGELVINKLTGVLLASDRGGFIHEFTEQMSQTAATR